MDSIKELIKEVVKFRDDRDWKQFHNAKDLATNLSIEASELLEVFLWKKPEEANRERLMEELADVLVSAFLLSHDQEMDVSEIVMQKLAKNAQKYPVDKARGSKKKYNEY